MAKVALLIGVGDYEGGLNALPGTQTDIEEMQRVLQDSRIGGFDRVQLLPNPNMFDMQFEIEKLFIENHSKDNLILLYFSGHAIRDDRGILYFATRTTRKNLQGGIFTSTAVPASRVQDYMSQSRCERQILILDCCFSGAFANDLRAKAATPEEVLDIETQLGGKGRAILTSSTATQVSEAGDGSSMSLYTRYLVRGMETGVADRDGDGYISVDELHKYAQEKVQEESPRMKPEIYPVREGFKIFLAKAPQGDLRLIYRKEFEERAKLKKGNLSGTDRRAFNFRRQELRLSLEEVGQIEKEVLQPYQAFQEKLQEFERCLQEALENDAQLSPDTLDDLRYLLQVLQLEDKDADTIAAKLEITTPLFTLDLPSQSSPPLEPLSPSASIPSIASQRILLPGNLSRRRLIQIIGFSGTGLGAAFIGNALFHPSQTPKTSNQPISVSLLPKNLQVNAFEFTVITVDNEGQKNGTEKKRSSFFNEDLGDEISLDMVEIPAGTFNMSSPREEWRRDRNESLPHSVTIQPFCIGKFQVSQDQWRAIAKLSKINLDLVLEPSHFKGSNLPVEKISWEEAIEFCARLSKKTGRQYRLPSEVEWEYACRARTTTPFHFGKTITTELANFKGSTAYQGAVPVGEDRKKTTPVGSFEGANNFGLYDMHGNVREWCLEKYFEGDDKGDSLYRVLRGGSWNDPAWLCRSATRSANGGGLRADFIGFRVVCSCVEL